jgi:hypothetical protein
VLWLGRWLLFRLMFASGCVKLLSGDPTWHDLTALQFHYETQPLPTWIAWHMHQLPAWFHRGSCLVMFLIELGVPFLIFLPRRPRMAAAWLMAGFMILIALTGNYGFFNVLTIALCVLLFDDAGLRALIPSRCRNFMWARFLPGLAVGREGSAVENSCPALPRKRPGILEWSRRLMVTGLVLVIGIVSLAQLTGMFRPRTNWPAPVAWLHRQTYPWHSINQYGLFADMTTNRLEIVLEGSADGITWLPYEFPHKPGAPDRAPDFVAPHQPRADWQMWFAALGNYRNNPWLVSLCVRLLEGKPEVTDLLLVNPFREAPPRMIRASLYRYRFTTRDERKQTGQWWAREARGLYLPAFSLPQDRRR